MKLIFPLFSFILPFPLFVKFFPHNFFGHIFWAPQSLMRPRKSTFRLKALGSGSRLRVLLVLIDQKDPHHALKKLMRIRLANIFALFFTLSWTFYKTTIKKIISMVSKLTARLQTRNFNFHTFLYILLFIHYCTNGNDTEKTKR